MTAASVWNLVSSLLKALGYFFVIPKWSMDQKLCVGRELEIQNLRLYHRLPNQSYFLPEAVDLHAR